MTVSLVGLIDILSVDKGYFVVSLSTLYVKFLDKLNPGIKLSEFEGRIYPMALGNAGIYASIRALQIPVLVLRARPQDPKVKPWDALGTRLDLRTTSKPENWVKVLEKRKRLMNFGNAGAVENVGLGVPPLFRLTC